MPKSTKSSGKLLNFELPQQAIEMQIEDWIQSVFESQRELATAMIRLRNSYCALLAGRTVTNADEILAQVQATLTKAKKTKNVV